MVPLSPQCRKHFHSLNTTFQGAPRNALEKRLKLIRNTAGSHTCPWFMAENWTPWIGSGKTVYDTDLGKKSQTRNPQVLWTVFWMAFLINEMPLSVGCPKLDNMNNLSSFSFTSLSGIFEQHIVNILFQHRCVSFSLSVLDLTWVSLQKLKIVSFCVFLK